MSERRHDEQAVRLLKLALEELARDGEVTSIRCDVCNSVLEIKPIGDAARSVRCECGKFEDTLRGL